MVFHSCSWPIRIPSLPTFVGRFVGGFRCRQARSCSPCASSPGSGGAVAPRPGRPPKTPKDNAFGVRGG
eukprot:15460141-Alexandrium_andersonii.AAC.1